MAAPQSDAQSTVGCPGERSANTSWPLPHRRVIDHARTLWRDDQPMIGIVDREQTEADLVAGELTCPG